MHTLVKAIITTFTVVTSFASPAFCDSAIPVCKVLKRLKSYRGKTIEIRGVAVFGREVTALAGENCPGAFKTDGYRWTSAINLTGSSYTPAGEQPVSFSTDPAVHGQLAELAQKADHEYKQKRIYVTMVGQLRVRKKYVIVMSGYGPGGNGYGHLGAFPAQLVIRSIRRVEVLPK